MARGSLILPRRILVIGPGEPEIAYAEREAGQSCAGRLVTQQPNSDAKEHEAPKHWRQRKNHSRGVKAPSLRIAAYHQRFLFLLFGWSRNLAQRSPLLQLTNAIADRRDRRHGSTTEHALGELDAEFPFQPQHEPDGRKRREICAVEVSVQAEISGGSREISCLVDQPPDRLEHRLVVHGFSVASEHEPQGACIQTA